jgi:hypothetical protein
MTNLLTIPVTGELTSVMVSVTPVSWKVVEVWNGVLLLAAVVEVLGYGVVTQFSKSYVGYLGFATVAEASVSLQVLWSRPNVAFAAVFG